MSAFSWQRERRHAERSGQSGRMAALVEERQAAAARATGTDSQRADALLDALGETRLASLRAGRAEGSGIARLTGRARHLFTLALFGLFAAGLMLAMAAGTGLFRSLRALDATSGEARLSTGLIANAVHATDAVDSVQIGRGPEGASLVLAEHLESGTYETRFYLYNGQVVQEYAPAEAAYDPAGATPVVDSSTFEVTFDAELGLLSVATDAGTVEVALRSEQGGAL